MEKFWKKKKLQPYFNTIMKQVTLQTSYDFIVIAIRKPIEKKKKTFDTLNVLSQP